MVALSCTRHGFSVIEKMKNESFVTDFAKVMAMELGINEEEIINAYDVFTSDCK